MAEIPRAGATPSPRTATPSPTPPPSPATPPRFRDWSSRLARQGSFLSEREESEHEGEEEEKKESGREPMFYPADDPVSPAAESGQALRKRLEENEYAELARSVAGNLGQSYEGVLFGYPELDKRREDARRQSERKSSRTAEAVADATRTALEDIEAGVMSAAAGTATTMGPSAAVDKVAVVMTQANMIQQSLERLPRGKFRYRCGSRGRSGLSIPLDAVMEPSADFVTSVKKAAVMVNMHTKKRGLTWKDLWIRADASVKEMFAELVSRLLEEAWAAGSPGRHAPVILRHANERTCQVLNEFMALELGTDEMWHFEYPDELSSISGAWESRCADPVARGMAFAGY